LKTFKIEGGHQLKGSIQPQGAKNEALQILCAVILSPEIITIHNIPEIIDVNKLIVLLGKLGVKIKKLSKGSYSFQADEINLDYLETEAFKADGRGLRGSIMIVGPLLARYGMKLIFIPSANGSKPKIVVIARTIS
jgi:UDP-N-acetylglucosamine 1-carboxyvinyltransferase